MDDTRCVVGVDFGTLSGRAVVVRLSDGVELGTAVHEYRHGVVVDRLPGSRRYQLTPLGRQVAVLFTKAYGRVLTPGLATLNPQLPAELAKRSPLATAWRHLDHTLNDYITQGMAAV